MFWQEYWWVVLLTILILPIISAAGFAIWIRRQPNVDLEIGAKCWDVFVKLIGALTVTVTGAMLFGKYSEDRSNAAAVTAQQSDRELALREAEFLRQKLVFETQRHDRKLKLLGEAKTLAARIAGAPRPDPVDLIRLNELYQADLIGVEVHHGRVEAAMVQFRRKLRNEQPVPTETLEDLSLGLSAAVEDELKTSEGSLLEQHKVIARLLSPNRQ